MPEPVDQLTADEAEQGAWDPLRDRLRDAGCDRYEVRFAYTGGAAVRVDGHAGDLGHVADPDKLGEAWHHRVGSSSAWLLGDLPDSDQTLAVWRECSATFTALRFTHLWQDRLLLHAG